MPVTSPALRLPMPTSTRVPTTARTICWQNALASLSHQFEVHVGLVAHRVERHHLAPRVDTRVGAAGAGEVDAVAEHLLQGTAQRAPHCRDGLLFGEAAEAAAVVRDGEAHAKRRPL